jgi:uncharacterized protein YdgA (DUF945 family)
MKKLIVVVVLIVVIAAGLPFINGILLERNVKKIVDDANAMMAGNPLGYSLEIADYKRGYASTELELKLDMDFLKGISGIDSITIKEHAKHGFLGVTSSTSLEGNDWYDSFIKNKLSGQDPLHIEKFYSLFGTIESEVILDEFSIDIEDKTLHINKAEIKSTTDGSLEKYDISGNWEGLNIDQKFSVNQLSIEMDIERITQMLWDSDAVISIENIDITDKGQKVKISDLKMQSDTDVDKEANIMGVDATYSMGGFQSKDMNIEDSSFHLGIKGVKLDAYEEFQKIYFDMVTQMMPNIALNDPARMPDEQIQREMAKMAPKIAAAYEKFLKQGLELQVSDVQIRLPQGEIKGGITLRLLKDMTMAQFAASMGTPEDLLDALYLQTDISLPIKLVGEKPNLTQSPFPEMKTGLFVKDGDYLVNKIETKDGKLLLNGHEVPLNKIVSQLGPGPQPPAGKPYMN